MDVTAQPVLTWSPHPLLAASGRQLICVPFAQGETIARYLDRVGIPMAAPQVLAVNGEVVPRELWAIARPKVGTLITLRATAEGGEGSNPLAIVATLVLAIVAPYAAGAIYTAVGGTLVMANAGLIVSGIAGGIVLVGGMVINALFAPPAAQISDGRLPDVSPTYSLSGGSNQARLYGPLPLVLGTHRVYADLSTKPYTEFSGDEQYLIQQFNFGYGALTLSDVRIGETAITTYTDIITEQSAADGVLTKFPGNVDSVTGGTLGSGTPAVVWPNETDDTAYVTRTSGVNAIRLAVDIEASIYALTADGPQPWSISFIIQYRIVGGAWTSMLFPAASVTVENSSLKPVRRTYYSPPLTPAQYEVRVKRQFGEDGRNIPEAQFVDDATWATLRTYQLDPADYEGQTRYGVWVKATGQLSGIMDRFSAIVSAAVPTWTGAAWTTDETSNPAWLFLYFARGGFSASGRLLWGAGLADARIDIEALKLWGAYCTANGLEFNAVIDRPMSVAEVLNSIARCGRGSVTWATGMLGVTWDDSEAAVVAQFGMSSIKAGSFAIEWASGRLADEIVVQFPDRDADYAQSEVRVLAPGVSVPTVSQTVQWFGCTSQFLAGQYANLLMANNVYRSRRITFETDAEGLVVTRGDRILLSHDLTQWGYSGRLRPIANLLENSEQFNATDWLISPVGDAAVTANATTAPDGQMTADKLYEATTNAQWKMVYRAFTSNAGENYTWSIYAKAAERSWLLLQTQDKAGTISNAWFNLATGQLGNRSAGISSAISDAGGGWYRCSMMDNASSGAFTTQFRAAISTGNGVSNYTGVIGNGLYLWGAMVERGSVLHDYEWAGDLQSTLYLDREVPRTSGTAAWVALVRPDGTEAYHALTDMATGDYDTVTLATPLGAGNTPGVAYATSPLCDWKWRFDYTATPGKRVKIAALEPLAERAVRITCVDDPVEYHGMSVLGYTYVAAPALQPKTPTIAGLTLTETLVISSGSVATNLVATWTTAGEVGATRVRWHAGDGVWIPIGDVVGRRAEFSVTDGTTVTVEVAVFNALGQVGAAGTATAIHAVLGKTIPPPNLQYFLVAGQADGTRELSWGYTTSSAPVDLAGYRVRYVSGSSGTWETMTPLHAGLLTSSPYEFNSLAAGTWCFAVKAVDTTGNESPAALFAVATLLDPRMGGVIFTANAYTLRWPGTRTGCWLDPNTCFLEANSADTWGTLGTWASFTQWTSNPLASWSYQHNTIDIGTVAAFTPSAACIGIGSFLVEEQHSADDAVYTAWATAGSKITARFVRLRATVTPTAAGQATRLESMTIYLDAKTIEEWITDSDTASWSGSTGLRRVPLTKSYVVIQQVALTLQSVTSGWSWVLVDKNTTLGPLVRIYNGSTPADCVVDAYVKGL